MNTIRLTYAPYGYGRVQRIITPRQDDDANTRDSSVEELSFTNESTRQYRSDQEDDEI